MSKMIDMTGWVMKEHGVPNSKLTVIERTENDSRGLAMWKCKCECGNEIVVRGADLRGGQQKSCGCYRKQIRIERNLKIIPKGTRFGFLTVIEKLNKQDSHGRYYYLCQCDCGNKREVLGTSLTSHNTQSCGCTKSRGETRISQILRENNISFEMQKTFDNCRNPETNCLFRFDFYVNNQYLLEYDGKLHFKTENQGWDTEENLKYTQKHDKIKNQYCKDHNIPLIRIPYTKYDTLCLEDLLLETSKYILK